MEGTQQNKKPKMEKFKGDKSKRSPPPEKYPLGPSREAHSGNTQPRSLKETLPLKRGKNPKVRVNTPW